MGARPRPHLKVSIMASTATRPRGEGQWKLGHREPLNRNEQIKKDDDGLNVRARIETIYAHRGFASIDPADLRGRLRWWGLYTQRKPGIDGGRTEVLDATPAIRAIVDRYIGDKQFSNLPRKFKSVVSWLPDVPYEANDIAFLGVEHPEYGPGFDLWVGGGLSTNPMLAQRLGAWVPLDEVPEVWAGVTSVFRDYGYRRLRHRARLKFLVADWGVERFRDVLESEYLGRRLLDGPAAEVPSR